MRIRMIATLAALVAAGGAAWAGGGKIKWESDFRKGAAEAKNTGKPILLYFTADW